MNWMMVEMVAVTLRSCLNCSSAIVESESARAGLFRATSSWTQSRRPALAVGFEFTWQTPVEGHLAAVFQTRIETGFSNQLVGFSRFQLILNV